MNVPHNQPNAPIPRVKRPRNRLGEIGLGIVILGYIIPAICIALMYVGILKTFPVWTFSIAPLGFFISLFAMRSKPKGIAMGGMALGFLAFNVASMTIPMLEKMKLKNEAAAELPNESKAVSGEPVASPDVP